MRPDARAVVTATLLVAFLGGCGASSSQPASTLGESQATGSSAASIEPSVAVATVQPTPTAIAVPTTFVSARYGYSITLPPGWSGNQAQTAWDGTGSPGDGDPVVDLFHSPQEAIGAWGFAAPTSKSLAAYVTASIDATHAAHGDTCPPPKPEKEESITIGGQPGTLLDWNCGVLINTAITIQHGIAYSLTFRDFNVAAATDPTDHAAFLAMLASVVFPS